MTVLNIFSPPMVSNTGGWGILETTQWIANPWATSKNPASAVWIQCTPAWIEIDDLIGNVGIGILEVEFQDDNGQVGQQTWGYEPVDTFTTDTAPSVAQEGDIPTSLFVPKLLSLTVLLVGYNCPFFGTVTLFQWG